MSERPLLVDPRRLLLVTLGRPTGDGKEEQKEMLVIVLRYVPVHAPEGARVAIELTYDPAIPAPTQKYYCPPERLRRAVIPPRSLRKIIPYEPGGVAEV